MESERLNDLAVVCLLFCPMRPTLARSIRLVKLLSQVKTGQYPKFILSTEPSPLLTVAYQSEKLVHLSHRHRSLLC